MRLLKGTACCFDQMPRGHGLLEYGGTLYYKTRHDGTYVLATGELLWPQYRKVGLDDLRPDSRVTLWGLPPPENPLTRDVADRAWANLSRVLERHEEQGDQAVSILLTTNALRVLLESEGRAPPRPQARHHR